MVLPAGIARPGIPARLIGTVIASSRYMAIGSLAFSFCIFIAAILSLPLYVGRVSRVLSGDETILSLVIIAAGNVMGLLVDLMLILPAPWFPELRLMVMAMVVNLRV